jgi:hypothetical protein
MIIGLPKRWFTGLRDVDTRWCRHPVKWLKWRSQVRRLGPYAPNYDEFDRQHGRADPTSLA